MSARKTTPVIGGVALLVVTALVFRAFDADSHSASDTLRPFLITMVPAWAAAVWGSTVLLRHR